MENAINCVALFSKTGSSIRDFSRKEKKSKIFQEKKKIFKKILVKRDITLKLLREDVRYVMFLLIFQFKHGVKGF